MRQCRCCVAALVLTTTTSSAEASHSVIPPPPPPRWIPVSKIKPEFVPPPPPPPKPPVPAENDGRMEKIRLENEEDLATEVRGDSDLNAVAEDVPFAFDKPTRKNAPMALADAQLESTGNYLVLEPLTQSETLIRPDPPPRPNDRSPVPPRPVGAAKGVDAMASGIGAFSEIPPDVSVEIQQTLPPPPPPPPRTSLESSNDRTMQQHERPIDSRSEAAGVTQTQRETPRDDSSYVISKPPPVIRPLLPGSQTSTRLHGQDTRRMQATTTVRQQLPQYVQPQRPVARNPPPGVRQRSQTPVWAQVWRRIEWGLDNLADLEEAVSDRAQLLYSSTMSNVKIPLWKTQQEGGQEEVVDPFSVSALTAWGRPKHRRSKIVEDPAPQLDLSRFTKKAGQVESGKVKDDVEPSMKSQQTSAASGNLYSTLYQQSKSTGGLLKNVSSTEQNQGVVRKVEWINPITGKSRTPLHANGGASIPQDVRNPTPSSFQQSVNIQRPLPTNPFASASNPLVPSSAQTSQGSFWETQRQSTPQRDLPNTVSSAPRRPPPVGLDDEEDLSFAARLARFIPPIPRISKIRWNPFSSNDYGDYSSATLDAWKVDDDEAKPRSFLGRFFRKKERTVDSSRRTDASTNDEWALSYSLVDLMGRCDSGNSSFLLTESEKKSCRSIGRTQAMFDVVKSVSLLIVARELSQVGWVVPRSSVEFWKETIPSAMVTFVATWDSWLPHAASTALLAHLTSTLIRETRLENLASSVAAAVTEESQYAALFVRLISSTPSSRDTSKKLEVATRTQVVEKSQSARLRMFVATVLLAIALSTMTDFVPIITSFVIAVAQTLHSDHWKSFPPALKPLLVDLKEFAVLWWQGISTLVAHEVNQFLDYPLKSGYTAAVCLALTIVALLPRLENGRKVSPLESVDAEDDEALEAHRRLTQQIENIGGSSASRLDVLADGSAVEALLDRWKVTVPKTVDISSTGTRSTILRTVSYIMSAGVILAAPIFAFAIAGISPRGAGLSSQIHWDSLFDITIIFVLVFEVACIALKSSVMAKEAQRSISSFLATLRESVDERKKQTHVGGSSLQLNASISPTAGIIVKDLWSAHTMKRAWAVRGANLGCRNGEIVMLLGDAGSGKSRLLTSLAESITGPPRGALSATRVRGSVAFGNLDVDKWDKAELTRRTGLFLSDACTVTDLARVLSGLSIEEILEPSRGTRGNLIGKSPGQAERGAMLLALKLTGLYSSLLPRLPSKLSTVITANEEDLRPSDLRPRCHILSTVDWSKLLLTRVLVRIIYDNAAGNKESVDNCLVGSYLLLDDVMVNFSEAEEARFFNDLRRTGAATVLSSVRWASGRFADRIAVLRDGAIVESGTHNELLNRGPQQSIYAAKWHAMSMS